MIARKVRKCPLSPFVTSNVVLSYLVRMADILARLAQKADSLSALQLTGALWYSLSNTPTTPPPPHSSLPPASAPHPTRTPPHFLDRSAAPVFGYIHYCIEININLLPNTCNFYRKFRFIFLLNLSGNAQNVHFREAKFQNFPGEHAPGLP